MFRRGSFWFGLFGFIVLGVLLVAGGALLFQAGQSQGYALGLAAANGETPPALPLAGTNAFRPWLGFSPFVPLFVLLCLAPLAFFTFLCLLRFFTWGAWRHHHSRGRYPWGPPPWPKDQHNWDEEQKPL